MAEQEDTEKRQAPEFEAPPLQGPRAKVLPWLVPAVVVLVFAAGGFLIGRSFGTRGQAQTASGAEAGNAADAAPPKEPALKDGTGPSWYFDLDPVVVNLNDPGVTRYVRISLTLEVSGTMDEKEGKVFLDQKKPLMKHWLTLYLSNQTIEDARGERNLTRMQTQISETLNAGLFPEGKPRIKSILFKEFAIQ
jgi:flagellar basal body-associated protein FliL